MLKNGNAVKKQMGTDYGIRVKPVKVMIAKKIAQLKMNVVPVTPVHHVGLVKTANVYPNVQRIVIVHIINVAMTGVVLLANQSVKRMMIVLAVNVVRTVHVHMTVHQNPNVQRIVIVRQHSVVKAVNVLIVHQNQSVKRMMIVRQHSVVKAVNVLIVIQNHQMVMINVTPVQIALRDCAVFMFQALKAKRVCFATLETPVLEMIFLTVLCAIAK
jgi:hypothetical protein